MAEPTIPQERSAGSAGMSGHLRSLAASVAAYFQARLQLAGLESKEAAAHCLKIILWIAAGFFAAVFGYVFLCSALVLILAHLSGISWVWIMLGLGIVHFIFAFACVVIVRRIFPRPMFESTINELKKDQEWLTTPSKLN